jgi:hypothetical protein
MPQSTPPSFEPRRRNPRAGPLQLPAKGFDGEVPVWPLAGRQSKAEQEAWGQLWRTPQAFAWDRLGWTRTVARYCRIMVRAERPGSTAAIQASASRLETELGLTPKAMRLLLWTVESASAPEPDAAAAPADELDEARRRLRPAARE